MHNVGRQQFPQLLSQNCRPSTSARAQRRSSPTLSVCGGATRTDSPALPQHRERLRRHGVHARACAARERWLLPYSLADGDGFDTVSSSSSSSSSNTSTEVCCCSNDDEDHNPIQLVACFLQCCWRHCHSAWVHCHGAVAAGWVVLVAVSSLLLSSSSLVLQHHDALHWHLAVSTASSCCFQLRCCCCCCRERPC